MSENFIEFKRFHLKTQKFVESKNLNKVHLQSNNKTSHERNSANNSIMNPETYKNQEFQVCA